MVNVSFICVCAFSKLFLGSPQDSLKEVKVREVNKAKVIVLDEGNQDVPINSAGVNSNDESNHKESTELGKTVFDSKLVDNNSDAEGSAHEKVLKKPDKLLPCPRCDSMDTKFCYYNNYNFNQPRHFCKNCQRYWTAGGAMRNVPVGAGRRKSKQSVLQHRQIIMPEDGFQYRQLETPELTHHQILPRGASAPARSLNGEGTILEYGTKLPLCESGASILNVSSKLYGENREEPSCSSSITTPIFLENGLADKLIPVIQNGMLGYGSEIPPMPQFPCHTLAPCVYPWNLGWTNIAPVLAGGHTPELVPGPANSNPNVPWSSPNMPPTAAFCPPIPLPSIWGCIYNWPNGAWNLPWLGFNNLICGPSSLIDNGFSGYGSPTLGKHSRDASLHVEEKSILIPKTLRIDDPNEAAKSSIWATLGIKPEVGIFKPFRSKSANKGQTSDAAQVLQANPAALSRSQSFQESS